MQGAAKGGLSGFIKGVGRGMVGVVAKSATGVFDAAAKVSQGYAYVGNMLCVKPVLAQRQQRFVFGVDGEFMSTVSSVRCASPVVL